MKHDSLKELQEAVRILDNTKNDTADALVKEDITNALSHIRAALFMETPCAPDKFNLYDVADDDNGTREIMGCVHHENGFRVASDGRVLVAVKENYPEDMEGKNIDKKGEARDLRYPMWQKLFNDKQKEADGFLIDFNKLSTWQKEYAAEKKMNGKRGARNAYVKIGCAFFKLDILVKFVKFMKFVGSNTLRIEADNKAAACFANDGSKGLIMPSTATSIEYHTESLSKCWERKDDGVLIWEMA